MNLRKTAALLLSLIMCFSLILPVGSLAEGTVTAADNAKRSENLLAFAGRLHNMTEKYSAEYTKKSSGYRPLCKRTNHRQERRRAGLHRLRCACKRLQ